MTTRGKNALTILGHSPLFAGIDPAMLRTMVKALDEEHWPKRRVIMLPGRESDRVYVLLNGRVKISLHNDSGRELTLFLLGPGDVFNLECLLDRQKQEILAQSLETADAMSGPIELWANWLDTIPTFRHAFRKYLEQRLHDLTELAGDLALHDTMTRLVHLLLRYFNDGNRLKEHNLIEDLSHDELAHMIGTVRVVINRLLTELKHDAIIDTKPGRLRVLNLQKLLKKADHHANGFSGFGQRY
jgi:CRP-like cAMP-binding protein